MLSSNAESVSFLAEYLRSIGFDGTDAPDIIVFGFQEVIDLDNEDIPMDDEGEDGDQFHGFEQEGEEGGPSESIVYEDNSLQHFPSHEKSVFTVSMHPSQPLAVSGGEDDLGYIWNVETGETIVKLTGHEDSVTAAAFSSDGEMVATGGMGGKVRLWRRVGKENWNQWEFLTALQGPDEVMVSTE